VRFSLPTELTRFEANERAHPSESALETASHRLRAAPPRTWRAFRLAMGTGAPKLTADTNPGSDFILFQLWLDPPKDGHWEPETRLPSHR